MKLKKLTSLLVATATALSCTVFAAPNTTAYAVGDKIVINEAITPNANGDFTTITIGESIDKADLDTYEFIQFDYTLSDEAVATLTGDISWAAGNVISIGMIANGDYTYYGSVGDTASTGNKRSTKVCINMLLDAIDDENQTLSSGLEKLIFSFGCQYQLNGLINPVSLDEVKLTNDSTGVWYFEDGTYTFTNNSDTKLSSSQIPSLPINLNGKDMSKVKTIYADVITTGGEAGGALSYNTSTSNYVQSEFFGFSSVKRKAYLDLKHTNVTSANLMIWSLDANSSVTIDNIVLSEADPNSEETIGRWVQLPDGTYYYNHGNLPDATPGQTPSFNLNIPDGIKMSDIQAVTLKTRSKVYSAAVNVFGFDKNGDWYEKGLSSPSTEDMKPVTIKLRGNIETSMGIRLGWLKTGTKIYISDIEFITEELPEIPIEPNDILIDDSEAVVYESVANEVVIGPADLTSVIKTSGTIKIYTIPDENATNSFIGVAWNDWGDNTFKYIQFTEGYDFTSIPQNGIIEIDIEKEEVAELADRAIHIQGSNFQYVKTVFAPEPDAPAPKNEEIIPDETEETNLKKEFNSNKENIRPEKEGPKKSADMEYKKLYIQKGDEKNYKGKKSYALRFVQKMKLSDLKDVKNTGMVINVDGKYVELTTDCYYKKVSIDGQEVTCVNDEVFIIFIIDNIPNEKEVSFSEFRFNK